MPGMPESIGIQGHHCQKDLGRCRRMSNKRLSRKRHNPLEVTVKKSKFELDKS